jgi:hypothetical protein
VEAGSVLRAGPAAGHIIVTLLACELVSMEMGGGGGRGFELSEVPRGGGPPGWSPVLVLIASWLP